MYGLSKLIVVVLVALALVLVATAFLLRPGSIDPTPREAALQTQIAVLQTQVVQGTTAQLAPTANLGDNTVNPAVTSTPVPALLPPSETPAPPTLVPPTNIPMPPSPTPGTPPGSILEVGQGWLQNEIELILTKSQLAADGVTVRFALVSHKAHEIALRTQLDGAVSAIDNRGRKIPRSCYEEYCDFRQDWILQPGDRVVLKAWASTSRSGDNMFFAFDAADPGITGVTIIVSGLAGINDARWHIPIGH